MAEAVHLFLKANGVEIKGDSTLQSGGRAGSIECVAYEQSATTAREPGTQTATGRRQYHPLVIRKRIDRSSPLLWKALCENQEIEATFKFYRPHAGNDGTTENFYNVVIKNALLASLKQSSPDCLANGESPMAGEPPTEEVGFVFDTIEWTFVDGGIQHEDSWGNNR
jgi:type VI secretion system secreted protein Hcp